MEKRHNNLGRPAGQYLHFLDNTNSDQEMEKLWVTWAVLEPRPSIWGDLVRPTLRSVGKVRIND